MSDKYMGTKHTLKEIEEATLREHRERIERGEKLDFVEFVLYQELKEKIRQYKMIIDNNDYYQVGYKRGQYDERQKAEKELFSKNTELEIKEFKRTELEKENAELKADNDARKFAMVMSEKVEKQLREENAELKEELKDADEKVVHLACNQNKDLKRKLIEAKEIIKEMLRDIPNRMWYTDDVIKRAEDFIK